MIFECKYCGEIFDHKDISKPIMKGAEQFMDWIYIADSCPKCGRGLNDWYVRRKDLDHKETEERKNS